MTSIHMHKRAGVLYRHGVGVFGKGLQPRGWHSQLRHEPCAETARTKIIIRSQPKHEHGICDDIFGVIVNVLMFGTTVCIHARTHARTHDVLLTLMSIRFSTRQQHRLKSLTARPHLPQPANSRDRSDASHSHCFVWVCGVKHTLLVYALWQTR